MAPHLRSPGPCPFLSPYIGREIPNRPLTIGFQVFGGSRILPRKKAAMENLAPRFPFSLATGNV